MNHTLSCMVACLVLCIIIAGCTQPLGGPATPVPTTMPVVTPVQAPAPLTDQELVGTWYLAAVTGPGGSSPVQTMNVQMSTRFAEQGALSGHGGCNSYHSSYALTGEVHPNGKGINIGPVTSTLMYCVGASDLETTFFQILGNATSYSISGDKLTISDNLGRLLVYQKTPYGPTAVPRGL